MTTTDTSPASVDHAKARAHAGYRAYSAAVGHKTHRGDKMPRYSDLNPRQRAAYQHAATLAAVGGATGQDVFEAYMEKNGPTNYAGGKVPAFADLPETIRGAWQAFADTAARDPYEVANEESTGDAAPDSDDAPVTGAAGA